MPVAELWRKVPGFTVPVVAGLLLVTFLYSVLVAGTVLVWVVVWGGLFGVGVLLFVVYLLYRLVVAVERIADGS